MRKLVLRIFLFLFIFLVIARIVGEFDNSDKTESTNPNVIRMGNASRFDSLDILFVGSSASYSGIIPALFDSIHLRTYNLSVAAAGPYFYKLLIDDYLGSTKRKPVSVVLLLMPTTFMEHADDFKEIGIHRYLNQPMSNESIAGKYNLWMQYPALMIKSFQKGVKNIVHKEKASAQVIEQTISDKGFYRSDETTSTEKEKKEQASYSDFSKQILDKTKADYLMRYADSLQKQGIEVVFFSLPGNKLNSFFNKQFIADYKSVAAAIEEKYIFMHAEEMPLDSSCFRNSDHLNTKGAELATKVIIGKFSKFKELSRIFSHDNSETKN